MRILKENALVQFSVVSFTVMVIITLVIRVILTSRRERNIDLLEKHSATMTAGGTVKPEDPFSTPSLTGDIRVLQWVVAGSIGIGFVALYASLVTIFWRNWKLTVTQRARLELVDQMARIITSTLDIDQVYEKFALELKKLVYFDRSGIILVDQHAGTATLKYLHGPDWPRRQLGSVIPLAGSISQEVITTGQTITWEDFTKLPRFLVDIDAAAMGLCSGIIVPLISKGVVIGTISLRSLRVGAYESREQAILERLANQIAPAIVNARLYEQVKQVEEQLRKLSCAVEQCPSAVMITDTEGKIE